MRGGFLVKQPLAAADNESSRNPLLQRRSMEFEDHHDIPKPQPSQKALNPQT